MYCICHDNFNVCLFVCLLPALNLNSNKNVRDAWHLRHLRKVEIVVHLLRTSILRSYQSGRPIRSSFTTGRGMLGRILNHTGQITNYSVGIHLYKNLFN